ncbi:MULTISPECIES: hypothetical protein [unclassified Microcoleus]|uniref:hypothetical protein n=1 Tax=unclassified Microcoleus TaxID=2642155 RepID=UPI002FD6E8DA
MMNLVELEERVARFLFGGSGEESLATLWERQRECSWKRPTFLKLVMQAANKIFLQQLNDPRSLDKSFRSVESRVSLLPGSLSHLRRPRFCSIKDFFGCDALTLLRFLENWAILGNFIKHWSARPEPSCNGPPKGFVPLPDAEIGGCARNDSLIAPAI